MESWLQTGIIIASLLASTVAFIWVALKVGNPSKQEDPDYSNLAERDVEHIFNDEFREELRNRGRLHFEKIIGENAMFLQQDMRLTTSEINSFMKQEITKTLKDAFEKYESSISDAKDMALESIQKTQSAVEEQREMMSQQLQKEIAAEKERVLGRFHDNMADVVNHYVLAAIGNQISLDDQLEYILGELEENKKAIIEDITRGT
jgi:vacuolar-type H+-ATPase subunit H